MTRENLSGRRHALLLCLIFSAVISWWGCAAYLPADIPAQSEYTITAVPWPEADALFHGDQHWLGGDGAYSVDLGGYRVLWLFGDSFIDPGITRDRTNATVVRNSLAVQHGTDPSTASITFYWGVKDHIPSSFFGDGEAQWFWPGGGALLEDELIIFLMKIQRSDNELGFEAAGFSAVLIDNPDSAPPDWNVTWLAVPQVDPDIVIGSASVLAVEGYLYAFGADGTAHDAYLVRWKISDVLKGELMHMEWWEGSQNRWVRHDKLAGRPAPVFSRAQMEFTVHYEPSRRCFLQVQTMSLTDPCLSYRTAPQITGPWSDPKPFYDPPEKKDSTLLIYAGKAHRGLTGADLVFTYAVNSMDMDRLLADEGIYYPVFVRGTFSEQ